MVRTRFSEGHEDATDAYLSPPSSSATRNSRSGSQDIISTIHDGHLYDSPRGKKQIFDFGSGSSKKLRRSSSPVFPARTRRQSQLHFSGDPETPKTRAQTSSPRSGPSMSRRRTRRSALLDSTPEGDYEEEPSSRDHLQRSVPSVYRRRQPRRNHSPETQPRRSNRRRKPIYATMDQNLLGDMQLAAGVDLYGWSASKRNQPPERKDTSEDDNEKEDEDEEDEADEHDEEENGEVKEEQEDDEESERLDMYSRVKQRHIQAKKMKEQREMMQREEEERRRKQEEEDEEEEESEEEEEDTSDDEDDSDDDDDFSEESERETRGKNYHLREHRAPTKRFEVPVEVRMPRRRKSELEDVFGATNSPIRRRYPKSRKRLTPIRSPRFKRRKHHATHHSSSTSSEGSDDERRFERRKSKSMAKARMRCLPMNLNPDDVSSGVLRDRQKIGTSLADVDPMNIDTSITFESVGGLNKHIQSLKEMVVFPLLYPEVFAKFKINPPRGVLFHGPPGTGKTLVARALANECRNGDKRVAFFMRKGADCLSKWVGESERQLRLLFDQAYMMRPSIIFFDEIDGLAPVRSSRQDQIHSSIVSTLLALMDGLDSRGEIVVIGATNRIDSIDPALRRPGRFDREFLFQLPSCKARKSILSIHTSEWNPKLSDSFLSELAERCVGYCGADLKALCTETALYALRHQFPQIYASKEKLQLDLSQIQVSARDFHLAMQNIVPAAQRAVVSPGRALSVTVKPLLKGQLDFIVDGLRKFFPVAFGSRKSNERDGNNEGNSEDVIWELLNGDVYDDDEGPSIFVTPNPRKKRRTEDGRAKTFLNFSSSAFSAPSSFRPRILISGSPEQGHSSHVAPAILHRLEGLPVHCLDLPALYAVSAKNPEESCAQVFHEARRTAPSVIYMPHIVQWWQASGYTLQATFLTLLQDLPPTSPILLLATADCTTHDIPLEVKSLFSSHREMYHMRNPTTDERREFFKDLLLLEAVKPPPKRKQIAAKALEVVPVAAPQEPQRLTETEEAKLRQAEEATLRELRIFLREVLSRIAHEKKFRTFAKAVDPEEVPDYFAVIKNPMDLSTMMNKINMHEYTNAKDFLVDIDLITSNALEYNPDVDPSDRLIRNYACELKDMAYAIIDAEMDSDFERTCVDIAKSRSERGHANSKDAPSFYRTLPQLQRQQAQEVAKRNPTPIARPIRTRTPGSLGKPKKRRRSAWARGCIPKPKKKEPRKSEEPKENDGDCEQSCKEKEDDRMENGEGDAEKDEESNEEGEPGKDGDSTKEDIQEENDETISDDGKDERRQEEEEEEEQEEEREEQGGSGKTSGTDDEANTSQKAQSPSNNERLTNGVNSDSDNESVRSAPAYPSKLLRVNVGEDADGGDGGQTNGCSGDVMNKSNSDALEKEDTKTGDGDKNDGVIEVDHILPLTRHVEVPVRRVTRRMLADNNCTRAMEILEEPEPELIIDKQHLQSLLDTVVAVTTNWTVSRLEMLHCRLSQCLYRHRMEYNKTKLLQDMEEICESMVVSSNNV